MPREFAACIPLCGSGEWWKGRGVGPRWNEGQLRGFKWIPQGAGSKEINPGVLHMGRFFDTAWLYSWFPASNSHCRWKKQHSAGRGRTPSSICYITVSETVEIPAWCQMVVPASCSANSWCESDPKDGILKPLSAFVKEYGLAVHSFCISCQFWWHRDADYQSFFSPCGGSQRCTGGHVATYFSGLWHSEIGNWTGTKGYEAVDVFIKRMLENVDTWVILSDVSKAKELLEEFKDMITVADDDLGRTSLLYHTVYTGDEQPICQRLRRLHIQKCVSYLMICWEGV